MHYKTGSVVIVMVERDEVWPLDPLNANADP